MNKRVQHQGGWVASFVVIGVLLGAGLLGGVYFIKSQQAAGESSSQAGTSKEETAPKANDKQDKSAKDKTQPKDKADDQAKRQPSGQPAPSDEKDTEETAVPPTGVSEDHELPTTGPAETLGAFAVFGLLAFAVASYLQSRRVHASL